MMDQDKLQELRELVEFLKDNGIAEFDMERTDLKVRIKFAGAAGAGAVDMALLQQMMAAKGAGSIANPGAAHSASAAAPAAEAVAEE
jgi:acetyl-CoA carboxylase biotin carboxyl carrier protein